MRMSLPNYSDEHLEKKKTIILCPISGNNEMFINYMPGEKSKNKHGP